MTEVLVALFLMAIGVIGVLTMFPVGAVQMGLALKDQRCAEAATQADAYMRWYWKHEIVEKQGGGEALWTALGAAVLPTDPNYNKPSPPVFVDPMGVVAGRPGTITGTGIQRKILNQITSAPQALRACTLLDGFTYDSTGMPSGSTLERENRYNWLWVIQRPVNKQKYNANMTIVVFDKRAHMYIPPNAEHAITGSIFSTGSTADSLGSAYGPIQKGQWLMDASTATVQLADFYRVSSVSGTQVELNLPVRTPLGGGSRTGGNAVYLDGAAEVFERPIMTADGAAP